jgi:hypothetical protein
MTEVTAKAPKLDKEATVLVDLGENVEDAIARFGAEVVFSNYLANVKIGVQSAIRRYLEANIAANDIQAKFDTFKPGVTLDRVVDPVASLANKLKTMSPEEQEAIFASLRAKLSA